MQLHLPHALRTLLKRKCKPKHQNTENTENTAGSSPSYDGPSATLALQGCDCPRTPPHTAAAVENHARVRVDVLRRNARKQEQEKTCPQILRNVRTPRKLVLLQVPLTFAHWQQVNHLETFMKRISSITQWQTFEENISTSSHFHSHTVVSALAFNLCGVCNTRLSALPL